MIRCPAWAFLVRFLAAILWLCGQVFYWPAVLLLLCSDGLRYSVHASRLRRAKILTLHGG